MVVVVYASDTELADVLCMEVSEEEPQQLIDTYTSIFGMVLPSQLHFLVLLHCAHVDAPNSILYLVIDKSEQRGAVVLVALTMDRYVPNRLL